MRNDLLDQHRTLSKNEKYCLHCRKLSMPCVKAFSNLLGSFNGEQIFIHHPAYGNQLKTYLFYDVSHHQKCNGHLIQFEKDFLSCL